MFDRIVVCSDGSEGSVRAAHTAAALARALEGALTAVVVLGPTDQRQPVTGGPPSELSGEQAAEVITATVEAATAEGAPCQVMSVHGSPAEAIVQAARTAHADLLVVGSRGLGALDSLRMGSVSERVLHEAPCPVLVVR